MIALFFDTETTGFKHGTFIPEIVQIGALLQDTETKRVLAEFNMMVLTKLPIPDEVVAIHGISDALCQAFGTSPAIADNMFALMAAKADVLVAHNIAFDIGIIADAWDISPAIIATKKQFCIMLNCATFDMPRKHAGRRQYTKLADAYKYFYGEDFSNAHDAMADVRACRDVYFKIMENEVAA
jgi:DNA polymerase-3 subunit epsilon